MILIVAARPLPGEERREDLADQQVELLALAPGGQAQRDVGGALVADRAQLVGAFLDDP